jgi:asparagine N-glycosylation enzyme membrane subunit Stt3
VKQLPLRLSLFLLALIVRALPWRSVLEGERVQLFGNDAYYHLRRIQYAIQRFPSQLEFDRYVNFPRGGEPIWAPGFDALLALALGPFVRGDAAALERAAVWAPPILGALSVVALHVLASRLFDASTALVGALILTILSAHFWYSQIGFVDHHAAVALTSTLLLASALELLRRTGSPPSPARRLWGPAAASGGSLALCLLVWPGSLLHVGLVALGLLAHGLLLRRREEAVRFALLLATAAGIAALGVAPFALGREWTRWSSFSPVVLSNFQPWLLASWLGLSAGCAVLWRWTAAGATAARRRLSAGLVAAALAGASALLFPELRGSVADAWTWFAKAERFQASVGESAPLLLEGTGISFRSAELRLSRLLYLFPPALGAALWKARGGPGQAPLRLFLGWSAALAAATLVQLRFMNSFSVAFSILMGWACVALFRALPRRWRSSRGRRLGAGTASALLLAILCQPMLPAYARHLRNQLSAVRGGPLLLTHFDLYRRALVDVGLWLRENTPPTSGWLDPAREPEYGILSAWSAGHVLRYAARRPLVRDNFGDDVGAEGFQQGLAYFLGPQSRAADTLDRLRVRYVVVQPQLAWEGEPAGRLSMFERLYLHDGSRIPSPGNPAGPPLAPGLERHRLVYESEHVRLEGFPEQPSFKVFEYVPGARLGGRTQPGALIEVRLELRTNRDRSLAYQTAREADASGRYAFRLPYATRGGPPAVRTHFHYTISCWRDRERVVVDEAQIQSGAEIAGPDLCL